ncbi:MAG TPA: hypothetical protein VFC17_06015 [Candidatus Limnocylindrales bacterium]|nr:hypothetical protein [Candidatus Limnocylindrales bacterium]
MAEALSCCLAPALRVWLGCAAVSAAADLFISSQGAEQPILGLLRASFLASGGVALPIRRSTLLEPDHQNANVRCRNAGDAQGLTQGAGLFIGSGVVEAGCKTVIGQRLKQSGMRWSVPGAALGFISPIFCAAAMGASDLIVIGNALRLLRWRI